MSAHNESKVVKLLQVIVNEDLLDKLHRDIMVSILEEDLSDTIEHEISKSTSKKELEVMVKKSLKAHNKLSSEKYPNNWKQLKKV